MLKYIKLDIRSLLLPVPGSMFLIYYIYFFVDSLLLQCNYISKFNIFCRIDAVVLHGEDIGSGNEVRFETVLCDDLKLLN